MDAFTRALVVYSVQILVTVAAAGIAARLMPLPSRTRLILWQLVVLFCLLLPLAPARTVDVPVSMAPAVERQMAGDVHMPSTGGAPALRQPAVRWTLWLVVAGAIACTVRLVLGLVALRRLRGQGLAASFDGDIGELYERLAPKAELQWHAAVEQPVTFGVRRPAVLLPLRLDRLSRETQRAVVCHELLHVRRGDWIPTVVEEFVRGVFWFHPAMAWAISQVHLSREETVDALAVSITSSRRGYVKALLEFADTPAALAPAFIRRGQLATRVRRLSQEVVMSRTRLALSLAAIVATVSLSGWSVVSALPMRSDIHYTPIPHGQPAQIPVPDVQTRNWTSPQPSADARLVFQANARVFGQAPAPQQPASTPTTGTTGVVSRVMPTFPAEALERGVGAIVIVQLTIGPTGEVVEANAVDWQLRLDREITDPNYWAGKPDQPFIAAAEEAARRWKFEQVSPVTTSERIAFTFLSNGRVSIQQPQPVMFPAAQILLGTTAIPVDAAPTNPTSGDIAGRATVYSNRDGAKVVRVGGAVRAPRPVAHVDPVYPEEARAARVQGVVILEVRIATDGSVADARILRSVQMLDQAALDAVRQWQYEPTLLNGEPVEVLMVVTVNFNPNK